MAQLAQDRNVTSMRNALQGSSYPADWYIEDDEPVAQSVEHHDHEVRLKNLLRAWVGRTGRDWLVSCELAFRWDRVEPRVGVDPDVFIAEMPPRDPDTGNIYSMRTWEEGNSPPILAIEIVSRHRPKKDYSQSPLKHDLLGTNELWVFDPELKGHSKEQPSVRFQMFQRQTNSRLVRTYAGEGPIYSETLEAWVFIEDDSIIISNDVEGKDRWLTLEEEADARTAEAEKRADEHVKRADEHVKRADEQTRRADEQTRRADEQTRRADEERLAKEAALARIAELEALLASKST